MGISSSAPESLGFDTVLPPHLRQHSHPPAGISPKRFLCRDLWPAELPSPAVSSAVSGPTWPEGISAPVFGKQTHVPQRTGSQDCHSCDPTLPEWERKIPP
ncbi:hCG1802417, isoform CRA_a [Homo sapiens]|uniref:HCG1802417, isoform CRA_a n=1 Tax=Homo sapiens TaxID=9606 RepID=A8K814_HUMAN